MFQMSCSKSVHLPSLKKPQILLVSEYIYIYIYKQKFPAPAHLSHSFKHHVFSLISVKDYGFWTSSEIRLWTLKSSNIF